MSSTTVPSKPSRARVRPARPSEGVHEELVRSRVFLRVRRQITLPAEAVSAVGLAVDDVLEVRVVEGGILLVPKRAGQEPARSIGRFVGPGRGVFGDTAEQADALVRDLRREW
jgi:bifunctional DNA-binding transcriptional regulator/antitoxin component of YhaV-PrlF toxin-antitoxin module